MLQKYIQTLFFLVLFLPLEVFSQGRVSGMVANAEEEPLAGVTVVFVGRDTVSLITGKDGSFLQSLMGKKYQIHLRCLGYEEKVVSIQTIGDTNLGTLILQQKVYDLKGVVIQGDFIQKRGSGYTIYMRGNPLVEGKSLGEILTKEMPNISSDLKINANSETATVYLNGRKLNMTQEQLLRYLEALPAKVVDRIKVQSSNTLRDGGENKGGAIHISTRMGDSSMLFGEVAAKPRVLLERPGGLLDVDASLGYSGKKISVNSYFGPWGFFFKNRQQTRSVAEGKWDETLKQTSNSEFMFLFDNSLVYSFSEKHRIGIGLSVYCRPFDYKKYQMASDTDMFAQIRRFPFHEEDVFVNYDLTFGKKENTFSVLIDFLNNTDLSIEKNLYENSLSSRRKANRSVFSGKTSFNFPLTNLCELNLGADYLFLYGKQKNKDRTNAYTKDTYKESLSGIYAEFVGTFFERLDITAGFRYEYMGLRTFSSKKESNFQKRFNDWFPVFDIGYNFSKRGFCLSGGYERSVERPNMNFYLPFFTTLSEHVFYQSGHGINPEYQNKIYLTQLLGKSSVGVSYSWYKNALSLAYHWEGDNLIQTATEFKKKEIVNMWGKVDFWMVRDWLRMTLSANIDYRHYSDVRYGELGSWKFRGTGCFYLYIPKKWRVEIWGIYTSPDKDLARELSQYYTLGLAVQKEFDERFKIRISAFDIIKPTEDKMISKIEEVDFSYITSARGGYVDVSFTYNFGNAFAKNRSHRIYGNEKVRERGAR